MKTTRSKVYFLLLAGFLLISMQLFSQATIRDGQFELQIDLRMSENEQMEFARQYDIDTLIMQAVFQKNFNFINDSTQWRAKILKPELVLLTKNLSLENDGIKQSFSDIVLSHLFGSNDDPPSPPQPRFANYGVNKLSSHRAFRLIDGQSCFMLTSFMNAKKVMLAGSFNNWNTMGLPMQKTDSGWVSCLSLEAGKYTYKYIVDGRWMADPGNLQEENNDQGTTNSIVFVYNHAFELKAATEASKVFLAGSFNDWRSDELSMKRTKDGWKIPLYLREGMHRYKFVVDGKWITDPDNPQEKADEMGNINSVIGIGEALYFELNGFESAQKVVLSGNFNNWNKHELVMNRVESGWELAYNLAPGNYEYKFIVDGRWIKDPLNPYTIGSGDYENSVVAFQANHIFVLNGFEDAGEVILSGTFNGWNEQGYRMKRKNGNWIFPIYLYPGRYSYKFIVDGKWITDPDNPYFEENDFDTENSVIWIKP